MGFEPTHLEPALLRNRRLSTDHTTKAPIGYGERNDRDKDLINFAVAHGFKIINTFFQKYENKRWTWRSPNHDYILVDKQNIVKYVVVFMELSPGADLSHNYEAVIIALLS